MKAALIIIGNEILSGRTQDKNLSYLANWLNEIGIQLSEVRVIRDEEEVIIETVNYLRKTYSYVFTTGGIGPTHDDITSLSIAKAFNVDLAINDKALSILKEYYKDEPLFKESKVVTSVYDQSFEGSLDRTLIDKIKFDEIEDGFLQNLETPNYVNLMKTAIDFSDGLIKGSQTLPEELNTYITKAKKPVLDYQFPEAFAEAYTDFYSTQILN